MSANRIIKLRKTETFEEVKHFCGNSRSNILRSVNRESRLPVLYLSPSVNGVIVLDVNIKVKVNINLLVLEQIEKKSFILQPSVVFRLFH
jgi:hypothetical protein